MIKIWLPTIRALSGGDVYVQRLATALEKAGAEPVIEWLPHWYQYCPQLLKRHAPPPDSQVIHVNSWIAFAFRRPGKVLVASALHCVYKRGYPEWKTLPQSIYHDHFIGRFERRSFESADATVCISASTEREVLQDFYSHRIQTIPLWVDVNRYTPVPTDSLRPNTNPTKILIVGNLSRRKGGDLIEGFCSALGSAFDVSVVAGLRGDIPNLLAKGCASIRFLQGLGEAELIRLYQATDIVVSLSRHEGFGYTALEGMACGKPVVAFRVSGLQDVVKDGETGLLVQPDDVAALAAACVGLRANQTMRVDFGKAGRERAIHHFSELRAAQAHIDLYQDLLGRH